MKHLLIGGAVVLAAFVAYRIYQTGQIPGVTNLFQPGVPTAAPGVGNVALKRTVVTGSMTNPTPAQQAGIAGSSPGSSLVTLLAAGVTVANQGLGMADQVPQVFSSNTDSEYSTVLDNNASTYITYPSQGSTDTSTTSGFDIDSYLN